MKRFSGRLGIQQRVLPSYRVPFFDMLASACEGGMSLFAGQARPEEGIQPGELHKAMYAPARNLHLAGGPFYLCYQKGILSWLETWDPDALVLEANPRYTATASAVGWMRRQGRPTLGWGLGAPALSGALTRLRQWWWIHFLKQFDVLIAYSQRGAREYADLGYPRERIIVAHNAVSEAPPKAPARRPATAGRLSILFVGRLQARKRIDSLLRACASIPETPRLIIVGEGPERQELTQIAGQVFPSAEFVGAKHGEALKPYFAGADLFVLPGTGGLAVQQAMANALPVLVAKGDGTQDDLVRPDNGWLVSSGDESVLASTLREALADRQRLRKMGAESYRIVAQEINLEKMVAAFVRALNTTKG